MELYALHVRLVSRYFIGLRIILVTATLILRATTSTSIPPPVPPPPPARSLAARSPQTAHFLSSGTHRQTSTDHLPTTRAQSSSEGRPVRGRSSSTANDAPELRPRLRSVERDLLDRADGRFGNSKKARGESTRPCRAGPAQRISDVALTPGHRLRWKTICRGPVGPPLKIAHELSANDRSRFGDACLKRENARFGGSGQRGSARAVGGGRAGGLT